MPKAIFNQMQKKKVAKEFEENNRKLDAICYQLLKMVKEYNQKKKQSTITFFAKRHGVSQSGMFNYLISQGVYKKNRHLRIVITPGKECKALKGLCSVSKER